jgi:hypothetical protein
MEQSKQRWQFKTINGRDYVASEIVVHSFKQGAVEDPVLYAAQPLYEWEQSEAGKWVKEHAVETPRWISQPDQCNDCTNFAILARLTEQDQTYFNLKYS